MYNVSYSLIDNRLRKGWTLHDALHTPSNPIKKGARYEHPRSVNRITLQDALLNCEVHKARAICRAMMISKVSVEK